MSEENKQGVVSLVSNLVLLGTAGWGLKTCYEHPFISAGFGLFAVRGLVGTIAFLIQPAGKNDVATLVSNMLQRIDRAAKVFFFPLVATEVISEGCLKDCRLAVFNLLFPAIDYFLVPVEESISLVTRTACAFEIVWCNYMLSDWKNMYLIVPYAVNELSWSRMVPSDTLPLLYSYSCLVTAMYFTWSHPNMAVILDVIAPKVLEKPEEKISDRETPNAGEYACPEDNKILDSPDKIDNSLKDLDRAAQLLFFPLIAAEVMDRGCTDHWAWPFIHLVLPLVDICAKPVEKQALQVSRAMSLGTILWCDYKLSNWNNIYLLIPFFIDEVIWEKGHELKMIVLLDALMCLVSALVFTDRLPPINSKLK